MSYADGVFWLIVVLLARVLSIERWERVANTKTVRISYLDKQIESIMD